MLITLIAGTVRAQGTSAVDLNTWTQEGQLNQSTWNVTADGSSVLQTVNGGVGLFVSPNEFFNTTVEGSFGVETSGDDDFIGFVFGLKSPLGATTAPDDRIVDFLLFDWKQGAQSGAPEGFNLTYARGEHRGTSSDVNHELWDKVSNQSIDVTVLDSVTGAGTGWQDNTAYNFSLLYTADHIKIDVAGGQFNTGQTIFDLRFQDLDTDTAAMFENGQFESGRFGFYNYSQSTVRYESFTQTEAVLATNPDDGGRLNFGFTRIGDTKAMDLEVANVGGAGTIITGSTSSASGPFSGPTPDGNYELLADNPLLQTFTYSPMTAGFMTDSITVDTSLGSHTITLQGIGVSPVLTSSDSTNQTLDAGAVTTAGGMSIIELTLGNTFVGSVGDDTLTTLSLLDFAFTGADADLFELITPLTEIVAGDEVTLQIKFTPRTDGTFTDAQFTLLTDLNAAYGEAGTQLSWNLIGSAENVPAPSMLGGALALAGMTRLRRRK